MTGEPAERNRRSRNTPLLVTIAGLAVIVTAIGIGLYVTAHSSSGSARPTNSSASSGPRTSRASERVPSRGSVEAVGAGSAPARGDTLSSAMLTAADLGSGWKAGAARTAGDGAFCNRSLGYSGGERSVVLYTRTAPAVAVTQQAFGGTAGQATKALDAVRASAKACTSWRATERGKRVTYTSTAVTGHKTLGEDSAEYRVTRTGSGVTLHVVQVYVVQRDVLSILSYGTLTPTQDADVTTAESLAATGAQRLAAAS